MLAISALFHGAAGWYLSAPDHGSAYDIGSDEDVFVVELGSVIESSALFGKDTKTVQAVEAEPIEASQAQPEIQEVKPEELKEDTKVISSETGPKQETPPEEVKPIEPPQHQQAAAVDQEQVAPVEAKQAVSTPASGGDANARRIYEGKLSKHIGKKIVRPKSGQRTGKVLVRFTIDPSGVVLSREVAQSSGHKNIDEAALATIDKASPFPPAPSELASAPQVYTVPLTYKTK